MIMSQQFDEFSKSLADETLPRRESLRRLGAAFAGALFGTIGLEKAVGAGNTDPCTTFCKCSKTKQKNACIAACRNCGSDPRWLCGNCSGGYVCTDLANDGYNCGACGYECEEPGSYEYGACIDGRCVYACVEGADYCDGACIPVAWDPDNCGACGKVCPANAPYCNRGACSVCRQGFAHCNGQCIDVGWDPLNCGGCGVQCGEAETCAAGYCQPVEPYWGW
jgi:hypothetical protein